MRISGLADKATWQFSLDLGLTWQDGQDDTIPASQFTQDGAQTVLARQINAQGASEITTLRFVLQTRADDLDLSSTAGLQTTVTSVVDRFQLAPGVALTATQDALTAQDLSALRVRITGVGFDPINDKLQLDQALDLDVSTARDNIEIGGLAGLSYRYDADTASLSIWRSDGTALTGSDAAALSNALRLSNTMGRPREGERLVALSVVDLAGNVSAESQVSVVMDNHVPSLDLNGLLAGVDAETVIHDLATPQPLLAPGGTLSHTNPDATFQQVTIDISGESVSPDDHLGCLDGGVITQLGQVDLTITVAGVQWRAMALADRYQFMLADGSTASLAQTQALLDSLRLIDTSPLALEGPRSYQITVTDHLGRTGTATSLFIIDRSAPVIDLNGPAPGLDRTVTVSPGLPIAFPLAMPSKTEITEANGIVRLQFRFSSEVGGAFVATDADDPANADRLERFGLYDRADPEQTAGTLSMGTASSVEATTSTPGLRYGITCERSPDGTVLFTVVPSMTLTADMTRALLEQLAYSAGAGAVVGTRHVEITATDVAGNVSAVASQVTLELRPAGTPAILLSRDSDSGLSPYDGVTSANGSAASPLILKGYAAAGATVTVFLDADGDGVMAGNEVLGTVVADGNGRWKLQLAGAGLEDGVYRFGAVADGLTSGALELTVDTHPPASVVAIGDTVQPRPVLSGTTDARVEVTVEIDTDDNIANGYELRYVTHSDAAGQWRVDTATATPVAGERHRFDAGDPVHVRVTSADLAGNVTVKTADSVTAGATYSISDSHVIEGTDGSREMVFMVTRDGDLSEAGSVRFAVDRGASSAGSSGATLASAADFSGASTGLLSFAAGETSKLVRFTVNGDHYREVNEKVVVRLEDATAGRIADGLGIGNINEIDVNRLQAAYGLRDLNPHQNDFAIRVRRSSDNAEQDIGFDLNGELDRTALLDFVGRGASDKGFVTQWYDQSGNGRDMTQTDLARQGVIVDAGKVVQRADGSAAISFNNGRNGRNNDYMVANGAAADDWKSVAVYTKVQSEGTGFGTLFNLGVSENNGRLSSHYPAWNNYYFDVDTASGDGRLVQPLPSSNALLNHANDVVFEAHAGNTGAGTAALNYVDAKQVIFEEGIRVASDGTLPSQFPTSAQWKIAWHGDWANGSDTGYYQQAMYNEFLVFLDKDGTATPAVQSLLGTAGNDVLTYSGEREVSRIDGLLGHDALYVSGDANLDFGAFSGGVKGLAQVWMDNGAANTLTLTSATLAANGDAPLVVQMDAGDRLILDGREFQHSGDHLETMVIGSQRNDVIVASSRNDVLIGGGGADTFRWQAGQTGHDTVLDYSNAQGDRLDLTQLLRGVPVGGEDRFIRRGVDAQGQVELLIDAHGNGDFNQPELTITLADLRPTDTITVLTGAGQAVL
nr:type I secretion C-terminal target domain-containing protein [uncultured Roseateles sp.]